MTKLRDTEKLSAIYIGETACYDDKHDQKSLLRLLDCITSPADPADPEYDFQKDNIRRDLLRNNDFSSLRDECVRRGLYPPPDKSEMLSLLLTYKLDPTIKVSDHRQGSNPPLSLVSCEEMATTKTETKLPLPDGEEFRLLRNRPRIPGMPNAKPLLLDGLERREVCITPQRFLRSVQQAEDDALLLASSGGLCGYVVHHRPLGASTAASSLKPFSSVLVVLTDVDFRTLEIRLLADELASLTSQTVLLLDWQRAVVESPQTTLATSEEALCATMRPSSHPRYGAAVRRRMTDDLLATLRYASTTLPRELLADAPGDGSDALANVQIVAMGEAAGVALEVAALQQRIAQALAREELRQQLRVVRGESGVAAEVDGSVVRQILASFAAAPLARAVDDFQDEARVADGLRIVSPGESQPERSVNWQEIWRGSERSAAVDETSEATPSDRTDPENELDAAMKDTFPSVEEMERAIREVDGGGAGDSNSGADRWQEARQSLVTALVSAAGRESPSEAAELAKLLRSAHAGEQDSREASGSREVDPFSRRERGLSLAQRAGRLLAQPETALQRAMGLRADRATLSVHDVASPRMQCASIAALWPAHYDVSMAAATLRQPVFCVFGDAQGRSDAEVWASAVATDYRSFADAALFSVDGTAEEFVRSASPTTLLCDHLPVFALSSGSADPDELLQLVQLASLRCVAGVLSERDPRQWLAARRRGALASQLQVWLDVYGPSPAARSSIAGCFKVSAMLGAQAFHGDQSRTSYWQRRRASRGVGGGLTPSGELDAASPSRGLVQAIEPEDLDGSPGTRSLGSWVQFLHIARAPLDEHQRARWRVLEEARSVSPTTAALHWSASALRRLQTCFETEFVDETAKEGLARAARGEPSDDDLARLTRWLRDARNCFGSDALEPPLWK